MSGHLREKGVPAITVTQAKGYGEHKNFFAQDRKLGTGRIEIFTTADEAESIASTIMGAVHSDDEAAAGIVAILPVEQLFHIRAREAVTEADISCRPVDLPPTDGDGA